MTPKFAPRTHRAREHMLALAREIPDIWSLAEQVRVAHAEAIGGPDWPRHVYLPLEHAGTIAALLLQAQGRVPTPAITAALACRIAALSAWRMTQGIYRYDPALYTALVETPIEGDLPAHILQRLPEWCVYIETPDMQAPTADGPARLHGVYAWLDRPAGATHDLLVLTLDVEGCALTPTHIPLVGSLEQACAQTLAEWRDAYARGNADRPPPADWADQMQRLTPPILSLILYLCSEEPDLTRRGRPATPANPVPVRTRRHGWRLFPAAGPAEWDVGVRIGAALRASYQREQTGQAAAPTGRHVRPHVRRAHWHTILSGPRKRREDGAEIPASERRRELRWMPPIPINVRDVDTLPATVRTVRG